MKQKILSKKITLALVIIIIFLSILLYWFAIKPSLAKKSCSSVKINPYSQEEKDDAKNKFDENNCLKVLSYVRKITDNKVDIEILGLSEEEATSIFKNLKRNEMIEKIDNIIENKKKICSSLEDIFNSPDKKWKRQATNEEYALCLRNKGLDSNIPVFNDEKLESIQQSIDGQSEKIENLKNETNKTENENSLSKTQEIIESAEEKAKQESEERCQKELAEYNSCLSEYNAKLSEYNSCLAESSDPNSYRYGVGVSCYKPSNFCFKPICAY
jgi:chromosome segregation ATPase